MSWYEDWFSSDAYDLVYEHRDLEEAERCIDLIEQVAGPEPGDTILDVGCGRGRHALLLAERGYDVIGLDLSERALSVARSRAADAGLDVDFRVGDMREPVGTDCVDGVVNLFTTFGYFEDDADNVRALRAMATALRPGGWLVQDFLNAPHVRATLVPEDRRTTEAGITIRQERSIADGRINKDIVLERNGETHRFRESVRLLTCEELVRMHDSAGLTVQSVYGTYDGLPHTPTTPRCILSSTLDG